MCFRPHRSIRHQRTTLGTAKPVLADPYELRDEQLTSQYRLLIVYRHGSVLDSSFPVMAKRRVPGGGVEPNGVSALDGRFLSVPSSLLPGGFGFFDPVGERGLGVRVEQMDVLLV